MFSCTQMISRKGSPCSMKLWDRSCRILQPQKFWERVCQKGSESDFRCQLLGSRWSPQLISHQRIKCRWRILGEWVHVEVFKNWSGGCPKLLFFISHQKFMFFFNSFFFSEGVTSDFKIDQRRFLEVLSNESGIQRLGWWSLIGHMDYPRCFGLYKSNHIPIPGYPLVGSSSRTYLETKLGGRGPPKGNNPHISWKRTMLSDELTWFASCHLWNAIFFTTMKDEKIRHFRTTSILFGSKWCQIVDHIPYAPWNIYQHLPPKSPNHVDKYTSTMEHLG